MLTSISTENINGSNQTTSKDERALQVINGRIGEALGKLYERKFPAEAKAEKMIKNIFIAFENRINNFMDVCRNESECSREITQSQIKIGYPDKWKDYSALVIKSPEEGTYFENTLNMAKWRFQDDLADLKTSR
jgi:endothelin-converting enzyme/putative endopeptidase